MSDLFVPPSPEQNKALHEAQYDFYHAVDTNAQLRAAHSMFNLGYASALLAAAGMYVETACDSTLPATDRTNLFEHGYATYDYLYGVGKKQPYLRAEPLAASARIALRDHYQDFVLSGRMPPVEEARDGYGRLIDVGMEVLTAIDASPPESSERGHLIGCASEICVQLLLMRFGIRETAGEYVPLFAFPSEDYGDGEIWTKQDRWDISVFTQFNATIKPEMVHKVQVKTSRGPNCTENGDEYADDITTVYVLQDLDIGEGTMKLSSVIFECLYEAKHGAKRLTPILNQRTNRLLDKLG